MNTTKIYRRRNMDLKFISSEIMNLRKNYQYHHLCAAGSIKNKINFYSNNRYEDCSLKGKYKHCRLYCKGRSTGFIDHTPEDMAYNIALRHVLDILKGYSNLI
jgi:hypothetical protein